MKQNMSNTQGDRELALAMWKNMDEDTKTRMMKDAQYLVDQGVFPNIQEALKSEIYSKQKSPLAKKEARIKELENIIISKDVGGSLTEVAQDIANHVYNIQTGVYDGAVDQNGNPLSFAKQKSYFKDGDVSRQGTKEDGTMIYELTENGKNKYEAYEGEVVFDYRTGKLFKKQGTMLVEVTIGEKQIEE
jgi:histone deacetylase complex regulatory component SIN3